MSPLTFSANDIYNIAKQIECDGIAFYEEAAKVMPDEGARGMMLELANMERDHEKTFEEMQESLTDAKKLSPLEDPHAEAFSFLQNMVDGYVFDFDEGPEEFLKDGPDVQAILERAIGFEKDSITYYSYVSPMIPPKLGKEDRVNEIIQEEINHIARLSGKLRQVRADR